MGRPSLRLRESASSLLSREQPAVNIIVEKPADLAELLKKLVDPDFILLRGDELRKRVEAARAIPSPNSLPPAVVESVAVVGDVTDDLARLAITFGVALEDAGPTWVSLRLDDQVLGAVSEGDRALPSRSVPTKGWQVELRGQGRHRVRAELKVRLRTIGEGYRLECAIPEAGQTEFTLDVPQRIADAQAGPGEPIDHQAAANGTRTRLAAKLTPRSRLAVSWRVEAEPGVQLPPLLALQGEIAVEIEPGSFRTRSSWIVHAVRGSAKSLEFRLDSEDEVLEVELSPVCLAPRRAMRKVEGGSKLTINLIEALVPGAPKRLILTTRRPITASPSSRVTFNGFPLMHARAQTGAVGIVKSADLWVEPASGRGLQRIEPRDLPAELRARPSTALAYQFGDQPFELTLRVEPSPPLTRVEGRTLVRLSAAEARVETRLDYQASRGRLFAVKIALPRGLELESVGPDEVVDSSKLAPESPGGDGPAGAGTRVLTVLFKLKARELGKLSLQLVGRQSVDPSRPVALALFAPRETIPGGGRLAVLSDRNLTVELPDPAEAWNVPGRFRVCPPPPAADWPWPLVPDSLWLLYDGDAAALSPCGSSFTRRPWSKKHHCWPGWAGKRSRFARRPNAPCASVCSIISISSYPRSFKGGWSLEDGDIEGREEPPRPAPTATASCA